MSLLVEFEPAGLTALAEQGASLLDVAAEAGVDIDAPCGGQGRCGRCKVRSAKAARTVRCAPAATPGSPRTKRPTATRSAVRPSSSRAATPATAPPRARSSRSPWSCPGGARRSCRQIGPQPTRSPTCSTLYGDWQDDPPIRTETMVVEPPSLADNTSDLDRLPASSPGSPASPESGRRSTWCGASATRCAPPTGRSRQARDRRVRPRRTGSRRASWRSTRRTPSAAPTAWPSTSARPASWPTWSSSTRARSSTRPAPTTRRSHAATT